MKLGVAVEGRTVAFHPMIERIVVNVLKTLSNPERKFPGDVIFGAIPDVVAPVDSLHGSQLQTHPISFRRGEMTEML